MAEVKKCPHPISVIMTTYINDMDNFVDDCASYNCQKMELTPLELRRLKFEVYRIETLIKEIQSSIDRADLDRAYLDDDSPTELERLIVINDQLKQEEVAIVQKINKSFAYMEALKNGALHEFYHAEEEALDDFLDDAPRESSLYF